MYRTWAIHPLCCPSDAIDYGFTSINFRWGTIEGDSWNGMVRRVLVSINHHFLLSLIGIGFCQVQCLVEGRAEISLGGLGETLERNRVR